MELFWPGILIGLAIAAPVGPVNVLVIRRIVTQGWMAGLASGCGAAVADTFYGAVAAFGIAFVSSFLLDHQTALRLGGGVVLCALGVRSIRRASHFQLMPTTSGAGLAAAFASAFLLTLSNPLVLLALGAIFAAVGLAGVDLGHTGATEVVVGVLTGSMLWWLTLTAGVELVRKRFDERKLRVVSMASGCLLLAAGVGVVASVAFRA